MQFICRFIDPKIQVLSIEVGNIEDGQFVPVESVKKVLSSYCPNLLGVVCYDDILGTQAYIKFSNFNNFFNFLISDIVASRISSDLPLFFEDIVKYVKLSFYPMMIVIDIDDICFSSDFVLDSIPDFPTLD